MSIHRHQNEYKRAAGEKITVSPKNPHRLRLFSCVNVKKIACGALLKKTPEKFKYLASKSEREIGGGEGAMTGLNVL